MGVLLFLTSLFTNPFTLSTCQDQEDEHIAGPITLTAYTYTHVIWIDLNISLYIFYSANDTLPL